MPPGRTLRTGRPGVSGRVLKLAAIATAAGVYSGLFGVGGGSVMVPLLILWLGYDERLAAGTSLAAIGVIAAVAAAGHAIYGNVHVEEGLLVGLPAVGGVLGGIWLQQRIPTRAISLIMAAVAVAVAATLLAG